MRLRVRKPANKAHAFGVQFPCCYDQDAPLSKRILRFVQNCSHFFNLIQFDKPCAQPATAPADAGAGGGQGPGL